MKSFLSLCYNSTISILVGKLKSDYLSLGVTLFFVAVSFVAFLLTPGMNTIREDGGIRVSAVPHVVGVAMALDNTSLSDSSCFILPEAAQEAVINSSIFSAPEFLSLGEVKDPGVSGRIMPKQSGTVAYVNDDFLSLSALALQSQL